MLIWVIPIEISTFWYKDGGFSVIKYHYKFKRIGENLNIWLSVEFVIIGILWEKTSDLTLRSVGFPITGNRL